jgi:hypothetical protein
METTNNLGEYPYYADADGELRDYFAAHAPNAPEWWINAVAHDGLNPRKHEGEFSIAEHARARAEWAYRYADCMLKARSA